MIATRRARRRLGGVALLALALVLTACGVRPQESAEPLPANALPAPLRLPTAAPAASASPTPSPAPSPSTTPTASDLRLWFVQDDGLAAVESSLPSGSSPDLILQALAIGPTLEESRQGLRTVARDPLTGQPLVLVAPTSLTPVDVPSAASGAASGPPATAPTDAVADVTVVLGSAFSALPPSEQVLLLGQVVLSLAGSGNDTVVFTDDAGSPVAVPLPDGRLLDAPATARDYTGLIVRP